MCLRGLEEGACPTVIYLICNRWCSQCDKAVFCWGSSEISRKSFMEEVTIELCLEGCAGGSQTESGDCRQSTKAWSCEQGECGRELLGEADTCIWVVV